MKDLKKLAAVFALIAMISSNTKAFAAGTIAVDGSSTVYPITEAVAEEFQKQSQGAMVTVGISGTGGGFKRFCRGEIDIANASRPIKTKEADMCFDNGIEYIELPVAFDGLAVVINPKNDWATTLTVKELKKAWEASAQGKITNWNQINPKFPDAPIKLAGPGTDSGTFDYFTEAINGKAGASRGDFTASEDDNVLVQAVSNDVNALGYFGMAYYEENQDKLKAVAIDNGNGAVLPSSETVIGGSYQPLSRPLFIYVSKKSLEKPEVKAFVEYYVREAKNLVKEVGYVPLPDEAYHYASEKVKNQKIGSIFKGKGAVGFKIADLTAKEKSN